MLFLPLFGPFLAPVDALPFGFSFQDFSLRYREHSADGAVHPFRIRFAGHVWGREWFHPGTTITPRSGEWITFDAKTCYGLPSASSMSASEGTEFPPLWPPGFHPASLEDVQSRCVDEIDLSTTRQKLMLDFRVVLDCLAASGITCEIWLDGSFVTAKINPSDIDFIAVVESRLYDEGSAEVRAILDSLTDRKPWEFPVSCDTNVAYIDAPNMPLP